MSKAKELDQWFTKPEIAKECVRVMWEEGYLDGISEAIEPSAGSGAFLPFLNNIADEVTAFDIDPKHPDVIQQDWLNTVHTYSKSNVVIGNPPYGAKAKLAIQFINHALDIAPVVGFIVPITLSTSWTAQKNVRKDASLVYEMKLPKKSFTFEGKEVSVPSVFQIWELRRENIRLIKPETEHPDLEIRIYNKTDSALKWLDWDWDIAVKRNSKKGEFVLKPEVALPDTHWILVKGDAETLASIDWSKLNDNKLTAGMGKADVVKAYKEVVK